MSLTLNEDELKAILGEVEKDLDVVLKAEKERLEKDLKEGSPEGSHEESSEGSPEESSSGMPEASAGGEESSSGMPPMASPEAAPAPDAGTVPPDSASPPPEQAPGQGGEEDLEAKLMALPMEQLHHLYLAAKQALFSKMPAGDPSAGAPPMAPGPSAPPMAAPASPGMPSMAPAMKGEMKASPANGGGKTSAIKVGKSETNEDSLMKAEDKKQMDDLKAQVEGLTKAVTLLAGAPLRKAVTNISHMPKNDGSADAAGKKDVSKLSKSEITAKLSEKTREPTLAKKDREAINGFYDGRYSLDKIAHLLQ